MQRDRSLHRLSARKVEATDKPGKYMDGGGLVLSVSPNGGKRWLLRFALPGQKRREMGLGSASKGHVSLKQARDLAQFARDLVQQGIDPIEAARHKAATDKTASDAEKAAHTFGEYADRFLENKLKQFKNPKHRQQWRNTLEVYAAPIWGRKIKEVTRDDVLSILEPIWDIKHETAARVRGRLETIFDHAIQNRAYFGDNPARWSLFNATLSPRRKLTGRGPMPAMPRQELTEFITNLRTKNSMAALALEFLILGANRSGEVRFATWDEIDMEQRVWAIPGHRMKIKERNGQPYEHVVVLSDRMVQILEHVRQLRTPDQDGPGYVFPGIKPGKPLSDMSMRAVLRRMELGHYTVHGFRSTFRDWAGSDTIFPRELAEEALSHTLPDVERSYRREQAIEKRRVMMDAWQTFCKGAKPETNVVSIKRK